MISINLFSLYATLTLDDKDYKNKVKQSEDLAKKLAFNTEKAFSTIKTGLKVAATAAAGFVTLLAKTGLEYNAQMESYTTDFEVMLGSAAEAAEKVESLKQMAAKTPFELTDLASSTKMLLAFNVANEDTNTVLRQLGDISLGNVQKLDSLSRAYGKMNAAQKVTLEDINIMIDAGYNPLLQIAEKTGESMSELYGRISDGQVAFSEVQEAIAAATSEGGQFYQGMEKASKTTAGLVSTLKDVVNSKAGEFFSEISQKIKEALPNVIAFIENIDVSEVTQKIKEIKDNFIAWLPAITGVTAAIVAFRTAMTISVLIGKATKAMTDFKKAQQASTLAMAALNFVMNLNPFVLVATAVAAVTAALVVLWFTNEDFRNAVINIWNAIQEKFQQAWEFIKGVWDKVEPYFSAIWQDVSSVFNEFVGIFSAGFELLKEIARIVIDYISYKFEIAWTLIKTVWDLVAPYFSILWETVKAVFSHVPAILGSYFDLAWQVIQSVWNVVVGYFQAIFNGIAGIFSAVTALLRGDFEGAWNAIQDVFDGWNKFFSTLFDEIVNIFSKVGETFFEIGGEVISALKDGISEAWNGLVNWFNSLWDSLFGNRTANVQINTNETRTVTTVENRVVQETKSSGSGGNRLVMGSHRSGLDYVPFDGYIAELHKGERVLTADEARKQDKGGVTVVQNIYSQAKTAADLMREAQAAQRRAVLMGV